MKDYVVVFGAAVRGDGQPSAALAGRIASAARWASDHPEAMIVPTGGVGDEGPAEAKVMKRELIAAGINPARIIKESCARNTLESILLCDALLRERDDCWQVVCCTSRHHQWRCGLLFRLLGYRVALPPVAVNRGQLTPLAYARLILKEALAIPADTILLLIGRLPAKLRSHPRV